MYQSIVCARHKRPPFQCTCFFFEELFYISYCLKFEMMNIAKSRYVCVYQCTLKIKHPPLQITCTFFKDAFYTFKQKRGCGGYWVLSLILSLALIILWVLLKKGTISISTHILMWSFFTPLFFYICGSFHRWPEMTRQVTPILRNNPLRVWFILLFFLSSG